MYDVRTIANEFIRLASKSGQPLTNMQIQKLVYIAHGYGLAILHRPLIKQHVEAWRYGPVIPELYNALREYGAGFVQKPIRVASQEVLTESDKVLVATVFNSYKRFTGPQLSTMTHQADSPWRRVYNPHAEFHSEIISNDLIREYYANLLNERAGIQPA
ncbi:MAG: DUF4065 domain-containing protein [Pyrinomonadaceae bacterium]|nr:DUF4065 domain-containing protein [Pyrinomonadaceae bacterium]